MEVKRKKSRRERTSIADIWTRRGVLHRENEPAIIYLNSNSMEWWFDGKRHREDGPAIYYERGRYEWWVHGERHREDGPAVINPRGSQWWLEGKLHREDGPAVDYIDGQKEWWLFGKKYSQEEFLHWQEKKSLNEKLNELPKKSDTKKNKI